jgi:pyruvate/2-oxoglutarate dehydrogenase complex dihydrolipoamide acyltransferase (E2) component
MMMPTVSSDHPLVDGGRAAEFLRERAKAIRNSVSTMPELATNCMDLSADS